MATPEERLVTKLLAADGVIALAGQRVRAELLFDADELPAVTFARLGTDFCNASLGATDSAQATVEAKSIAATYAGAKALAKQVRLAVAGSVDADGNVWHLTDERDDFEPVQFGEDVAAAFAVIQIFIVDYTLDAA